MPNYVEAMEVRKAQTIAIFDLYNERRFDDLLQFYADDIVAFMPELLPGTTPDMRYATGKAEYVGLLARFRNIYGRVVVTNVLAVGRGMSVQIEDEQDNFGTFSIEINDDGLVQRIFFLHRARHRADRLAA
jgi:hypothetical protein